MPIVLQAIDFNTFDNFLTEAYEVIARKYSKTYNDDSYYKLVTDIALYRRYLVAYEYIDQDKLFDFMLNVASEREEILNRAVIYFNKHQANIMVELEDFKNTEVVDQRLLDKIILNSHILFLIGTVLSLEDLIMLKINNEILIQILSVMFNENINGDIVFKGATDRIIPGFEYENMLTTHNDIITFRQVKDSFPAFLSEEQIKAILDRCESDKPILALLDPDIDFSLSDKRRHEIECNFIKRINTFSETFNDFKSYQDAVSRIGTILAAQCQIFCDELEQEHTGISKTFETTQLNFTKEMLIAFHAKICFECIEKAAASAVQAEAPAVQAEAPAVQAAASAVQPIIELAVIEDGSKAEILKPGIELVEQLESPFAHLTQEQKLAIYDASIRKALAADLALEKALESAVVEPEPEETPDKDK